MQSQGHPSWFTAPRAALLTFLAVAAMFILLLKAEMPLGQAFTAATTQAQGTGAGLPPSCRAEDFAGFMLGAPLLSFDGRAGGYSADEARVILCAMSMNSGAGAEAYLRRHFPLDMAFALFYGLALAALWLFLMASFGWRAGLPKALALLPIMGALLDMTENLLVHALVTAGPPGDPGLIRLASTVTLAKWWLVAGSATVVLSLLLVYLVFRSLSGPARSAIRL